LAEPRNSIDRLNLPRSAVSGFAHCLALPREPEATVKRRIGEYLATARALAAAREAVDVEMAVKIAHAACTLLDGIEWHTPEDDRALIHAAAHYFLLEPDGESDLESITGFDDDAGVMNAVAAHLGREDLLIRVP